MPSTDTVIRVVSLCVVLAGAETPARHRAHGAGRALGSKALALRLSIVSGTLLAFTICWLLVPDIGLRGWGPHLALGAVLAAFMASFDILLGRFLLRRSWAKAFSDFDPRTGNLLVFGLAALVADAGAGGLAARINLSAAAPAPPPPARGGGGGRLSSSARVTVRSLRHVVGGGAVLPDGGAPTAEAEEAVRRASRAVSRSSRPGTSCGLAPRQHDVLAGLTAQESRLIPGRGYAADEVEAGCLTRAVSVGAGVVRHHLQRAVARPHTSPTPGRAWFASAAARRTSKTPGSRGGSRLACSRWDQPACA